MAPAYCFPAGTRVWFHPSAARLVSTVVAFFACAQIATASPEPAPRLLLLDATVVGTDLIAVGEIGAILRSSDSGVTWTSEPAAAKAALTAVAFAPDGHHGWTVGHDALILATNDGGRTWTKSWQGENLEASFLDVCALSADRAIAIGAYGLFLVTADGGKTWAQRQILDEDMHLNRITQGPTGTLYIAGERGTLLRSSDQGETWTRIDSPYDGSFYGILPLGPETLLAFGLRGRVFRSADNGEVWTPVPLPQQMLITTGVRTRTNLIVLAGQSRALFLSRDGGASFKPWATAFTTGVAELIEAPDGRLLAFGEAGVTRLDEPAPAPAPSADSVSATQPSR